jgi:hypothetical protein
MGTITEELSVYEGKQVRFVNLKLPNDSFIYTTAFVSSAPPTIKKTEEAEKVLPTVLSALRRFGTLPEKIEIFFNHIAARQRVEIYIWSKDRSQCYTVKWECGSVVEMTRPISQDEWNVKFIEWEEARK